MRVIIVYDVAADRTRPIRSFLREWLQWKQNSTFEGHLTEAEYKEVTEWIDEFVSSDEQVIVYSTTYDMDCEVYGDDDKSDRFL